MKADRKIVLINIFCSLFQQCVVIICGFILPRLIIRSFGSEVNGLVSSLTQFLSYISLIEGGLTGVITANLYKPLVDKNDELLSKVIKSASQFYKKIAIIFSIYTVILAVVYPLIVKTSFSFAYASTLTLILSFTFLIQYLFSISWKTLLNADKKGFIVSLSYSLVVILNTVISIVVIKLFNNIHVVKILSATIFLIQPIIYNFYVKRHYKIRKDVEADSNLLAQRWDGFAINLAAFIHNNTDIVVLSLLGTLSQVSVYSVYLLVVNGIKSVIMAVSQAVVPTVGAAYAKGDKEALDKAYNRYEFIILALTFLLFTIGGLCITPFVKLYTAGVTDVNYNQPVFGWFLILAELVYCAKEPFLMMAYSANKFKDLKVIAYIEAALNIVISLALVKKMGLLGVAIGTLVAMTVRSVYQIIYLHSNILNRSIFQLFKGVIAYGIGMGIIIFLSKTLIHNSCETVMQWIVYGFENTALSVVVLGLISYPLYYSFFRGKRNEKNRD